MLIRVRKNQTMEYHNKTLVLFMVNSNAHDMAVWRIFHKNEYFKVKAYLRTKSSFKVPNKKFRLKFKRKGNFSRRLPSAEFETKPLIVL